MKKIVIATIKNEEKYILEWVAYYRVLGFDNVLIITNDNTDKTLEVLSELDRFEWFSYISHSVPKDKAPQAVAYKKATDWLKKNKFIGWCLVCDIDEFLNIGDYHSLDEFLLEFDDYEQVALNWKIFGSSGEVSKRPGLVIERFTQRAPDNFIWNFEFKTIFKVTDDFTGFNSHYPHYRHERNSFVYADKIKVDNDIKKINPYWKKSRISESSVCLHHYVIKSQEEYSEKKKRGRSSVSMEIDNKNSRYSDSFWEKMDVNSVVDTSLVIYRNDILEEVVKMKLDDYFSKHNLLSNGQLDIDKPKIIQIGFNKCATTTLTKFYESCGLSVEHWDNGELAQKFYNRMKLNQDPFLDYPSVDGFFDMVKVTNEEVLEAYKYFEYMYSHYPNAYYILNTRSVKKWIKSRLNHGDLWRRYASAFGFDSKEEVIQYWTEEWYQHHYKVVEFFKDKKCNFLVFDIDSDSEAMLTEFVFGSDELNNIKMVKHNVTK